MKHILPLMNCGATDASSKDESARQSLIREIYMFLDQNVSFLIGKDIYISSFPS